MTLWQDPPPQTRRQARESERAAAERGDATNNSRRVATSTPTPAGEIPRVNTPFVFSSGQRETTTDTLQAEAPSEPSGPAPTRPHLPRYDALPFDAVLKQIPQAENVFRPPADTSQPEPVTAPVKLAKQPTAESVLPEPAERNDERIVERTLTRRELRAMLQAQQADQKASSDAPVEPASEGPVPSIAEAFTGGPESPRVATPEATPVVDRGLPPAAATPITASPVSFAPLSAPHLAGADDDAGNAFGAGKNFGAGDNFGADDADDSSIHHRRSFQAPTGHWSIAAGQEDDDDQATPPGGISRSAVSSGAATTSNALIMSVVPSVADATGPLTSTGEVLVTGSIDLPRGLGSTGQHPDRFDTADLDRMFDQPDPIGDNSANVAPVRASRAVSTHTSTRGMITPPKSRGTKLPIVLAITAAVLFVGVAGLLVAGFIFHAF